MNAARFAESVLGHFGVEFVGGEFIPAAPQLEPIGGHDEMQESFFRAYGTIALRNMR
jgi:hypothetical protein